MSKTGETSSAADALAVRKVPGAAAAIRGAESSCGSCWAFGGAASADWLGLPAAATAPVSPITAPVLTALNTAVVRLFDATAALVSGLPAPISDFLQGALVLVRRTLFNQAPTAAPAQYAQRSQDIIGGMRAIDPEGEPIVYTVVAAPKYGDVEIDPQTGVWTYTPPAFDGVGGTDQFTVRLTNPGAHINLFGPTSTDQTVAVTIAPVDGLVAGWKDELYVYNFTSHVLKYNGYEGDTPYGAPEVGSTIKTGEKFTFTLEASYFDWERTRPQISWADTTAERWAVDLVSRGGEPWTENCFTSGSNGCWVSPTDRGYGKNEVMLLDPPGTNLKVTSSDKQIQADWLNQLCFDGSKAECSYKIDENNTDKGGKNSTRFGAWKQVSDSFFNNTTLEQLWTRTFTVANNTETSWSLSVSVKKTIFDKILEVSITGTYGEKWSTTETWSDSFAVKVPPGATAYLYHSDPVRVLAGDFAIKLGNTTWNLSDVRFDYPDPSRKGEYQVTFNAIPPMT